MRTNIDDIMLGGQLRLKTRDMTSDGGVTTRLCYVYYENLIIEYRKVVEIFNIIYIVRDINLV